MKIWVKLFSKCIFALVCLVATNVSTVLVEGAIAAQSTDFNLNIKLPTCDVEVPKEYFLGTLYDGENTYPAFDVRVMCDKSGSNNQVRILVSTPNPLNTDGHVALVNGTSEFWLMDVKAGIKIDLTGQDNGSEFCKSVATDREWSCKVSPVIKINPGDPRGEFRINTIFSVYYY